MSDLLIAKRRHITIFTINRPASMNALDESLREDLASAVQDFDADPDQRVAIVTGAGGEAFSSGADLKEIAALAGDQSVPPISPTPDIGGVSACKKITIAAINGLAVGAGFELAISCDIRIAAQHAWFGLFEVKHGLIAGVAVNVLPQLMPLGAVMDLMLSAERLSAGDAHRLGLVQRVVGGPDLMEAAIEKAEMVAQHSQAAVWGTKQILKSWRDTHVTDQQRYYEAVMQRVLLSGDFLDGPLAFAEKRKPSFRNAWPDPFQANIAVDD